MRVVSCLNSQASMLKLKLVSGDVTFLTIPLICWNHPVNVAFCLACTTPISGTFFSSSRFFPLLAVPQATCLALPELVSVFLPQVRPQLLSECPLPDSSWRLAKFRPAVSFSHEACSRTVCKCETSEDLFRAFPHLHFCLRGCCCPFPNRQLIAQNSFFESLWKLTAKN